MPILKYSGFPDIRLLTVTINDPITLHYVVRYNRYTAEPQIFFLLREIDGKIIRPKHFANDKSEKTDHCVRTLINSICKDHLWTSQDELKALKSVNILPSRAPKAALISSSVLIELLRHFELDITALALEATLICLQNEAHFLHRLLLGLKGAVLSANRKFKQPSSHEHTVKMLKQISPSYPPPWQPYFFDTKKQNETNTPILDIQLTVILSNLVYTPNQRSSTVSWNSLLSTNNKAIENFVQVQLKSILAKYEAKNVNIFGNSLSVAEIIALENDRELERIELEKQEQLQSQQINHNTNHNNDNTHNPNLITSIDTTNSNLNVTRFTPQPMFDSLTWRRQVFSSEKFRLNEHCLPTNPTNVNNPTNLTNTNNQTTTNSTTTQTNSNTTTTTTNPTTSTNITNSTPNPNQYLPNTNPNSLITSTNPSLLTTNHNPSHQSQPTTHSQSPSSLTTQSTSPPPQSQSEPIITTQSHHGQNGIFKTVFCHTKDTTHVFFGYTSHVSNLTNEPPGITRAAPLTNNNPTITNTNDTTMPQYIPNILTNELVQIAPPSNDPKIDQIVHIAIAHPIPCQIHQHTAQSDDMSQIVPRLKQLLPFETAHYHPFSSQYDLSALKAPFSSAKQIEIGSNCLFIPYQPLSLAISLFSFLPPLPEAATCRRGDLINTYPHHLLENARKVLTTSPSLMAQLAASPSNVGVWTSDIPTPNRSSVFHPNSSEMIQIAEKLTSLTQFDTTQVVLKSPLDPSNNSNKGSNNNTNGNMNNNTNPLNTNDSTSIITKPFIWNGNEFNQYLSLTQSAQSLLTVPISNTTNDPNIDPNKVKSKKGRKPKQTTEKQQLELLQKQQQSIQQKVLQSDPRGFNAGTNAYTISEFTEFFWAHIVAIPAVEKPILCSHCQSICQHPAQLYSEEYIFGENGNDLTAFKQDDQHNNTNNSSQSIPRTQRLHVTTSTTIEECPCWCHIDIQQHFVTPIDKLQQTNLNDIDIDNDSQQSQTTTTTSLSSIATSTTPSTSTSTTTPSTSTTISTSPPHPTQIYRSLPPRLKISPEEVEFLSLPCSIPFPLLLTTAILYFHSRTTPALASNITTSSDYASEVISSSFIWLMSELKRPITFATTLIEFNYNVISTFYADGVLPDVCLLSDLCSYKYKNGPILYPDDDDIDCNDEKYFQDQTKMNDNNSIQSTTTTTTATTSSQQSQTSQQQPPQQQPTQSTQQPQPQHKPNKLTPLDPTLHALHPDNFSHTKDGLLMNFLYNCAECDDWDRTEILDDSQLNNYYPHYKITPEIEEMICQVTGQIYTPLEQTPLQQQQQQQSQQQSLSPEELKQFEFESFCKRAESLFPYDITLDNLPIWRSLLFLLETLPSIHLLRLFRHSHCLYPIFPNTNDNDDCDNQSQQQQQQRPSQVQIKSEISINPQRQQQLLEQEQLLDLQQRSSKPKKRINAAESIKVEYELDSNDEDLDAPLTTRSKKQRRNNTQITNTIPDDDDNVGNDMNTNNGNTTAGNNQSNNNNNMNKKTPKTVLLAKTRYPFPNLSLNQPHLLHNNDEIIHNHMGNYNNNVNANNNNNNNNYNDHELVQLNQSTLNETKPTRSSTRLKQQQSKKQSKQSLSIDDNDHTNQEEQHDIIHDELLMEDGQELIQHNNNHQNEFDSNTIGSTISKFNSFSTFNPSTMSLLFPNHIPTTTHNQTNNTIENNLNDSITNSTTTPTSSFFLSSPSTFHAPSTSPSQTTSNLSPISFYDGILSDHYNNSSSPSSSLFDDNTYSTPTTPITQFRTNNNINWHLAGYSQAYNSSVNSQFNLFGLELPTNMNTITNQYHYQQQLQQSHEPYTTTSPQLHSYQNIHHSPLFTSTTIIGNNINSNQLDGMSDNNVLSQDQSISSDMGQFN